MQVALSALLDYSDHERAKWRAWRAQTISRERLALHCVLHEIRHFAQIALAARLAGSPPPGEHDLFFYPEGKP
ncbi:MAG: hypothetical protein FJW23_06760 [Acidimicrobiia bacterium]|nr:hypothetical protein [Acidimicrobiia bacterium]